MLTTWILYEPAHGNWPDLEWARAFNTEDAEWLLDMHRHFWPKTRFKLRMKVGY